MGTINSPIDNLFDNSRYLFVSVSAYGGRLEISEMTENKNWKITSMLLILEDVEQMTLLILLLQRQNQASFASLATKTLTSWMFQ